MSLTEEVMRIFQMSDDAPGGNDIKAFIGIGNGVGIKVSSFKIFYRYISGDVFFQIQAVDIFVAVFIKLFQKCATGSAGVQDRCIFIRLIFRKSVKREVMLNRLGNIAAKIPADLRISLSFFRI